jgi:hypothetical protein
MKRLSDGSPLEIRIFIDDDEEKNIACLQFASQTRTVVRTWGGLSGEASSGY